jgi:hypothetical protein
VGFWVVPVELEPDEERVTARNTEKATTAKTARGIIAKVFLKPITNIVPERGLVSGGL